MALERFQSAALDARTGSPLDITILIDHAFISGGQAKVALESAIGLRARGHAVTVFAASGPPDPRLELNGVDVVCLDQPDTASATDRLRFIGQYVWNRTAADALARFLETRPQGRSILHIHGWAKALSPSIGRPIARSGLPVVYTMHEYFLINPNGGFYDHPARTICTRRSMSAACLLRNCDSRSYAHKLLRVVRQVGLDRFSGLRDIVREVIIISDLQQEVAQDYFPKGTTFHRVSNPIPVPDLGPKPPDAGGRFIFVGRLSPEKGIDVFAAAAERLGVRPVIIGDGPSGAELKARFPNADYLGWRDPATLIDAMRAARALVFPSVWYEGQPLTVHEALAVGTPVIVSDVCAGREAVADGETGFWFRSGDAESLAAKMTILMDDRVASDMGAAAYRRYWRNPLTLDSHLDRLEAVYAAVHAKHADGSARVRAAAP